MTKLLLLDMDGTVRECKSNPGGFINSPEDQELIEGVSDAIARYPEAVVVGITNQGGCAAIDPKTGNPYKSLLGAIVEQNYTMELCPELAAIIFCPDFEGETIIDLVRPGVLAVAQNFEHEQLHQELKGTYRKPGAGMLLRAIAWLGVNKADTLFVGDRPEDEQAALAAGVKFVWASDWLKS